MKLTKEHLEHMLRFDGVPEGTFFADLSDEQLRALLLQEKLGKELAGNNPEIAEVYRDLDNFKTLYEIGEAYLLSHHSKDVTRHAVAYAIKTLIPEDELQALQAARKRRSLEIQVGGFDSDQCRERARAAWEKKPELSRETIEKMIRKRGQVPWTEEEKSLLVELVGNPEYQRQSGQHKGRPDYELIALELNITFHDCEEIRYSKSIGNYMRDLRRKERKRNT